MAKAEAKADGAVPAAPEAPQSELYVTDVDREIMVGVKPLTFKAGVPRQVPPQHVQYLIGMGVRRAE